MYKQVMSIKDSPYCECLYFSMGAFSREMQKLADIAFGEVGLSPSHAFVLMTVNSRKSVRPGDIASEIFLSPSTVTRLIDKLELLKLVEKQSEGKYMIITPTSKGMEKDLKIRKAWQNLNNLYTERLTQSFSKKLIDNLHEAYVKSNTTH